MKNHAFYQAAATGSYYAHFAVEAVRINRALKKRALSSVVQGFLWIELAQYREFLMTGYPSEKIIWEWTNE